MADPLTPAQVEVLQQWLEDRQTRMRAEVEEMLAAAIVPLQRQLDALTQLVTTMQEALTTLDQAAVRFGSSIAWRASSGAIVCAEHGGPTGSDEAPFVFLARLKC